MVSESPAKSKPKLPQSMGSSVGYLPPAVPRQREPYLYPFKLPLVAMTLTALATVALSPLPRYQDLLWILVFFSSCSLLSVTCQAIRMITTVRKYHNLYAKNAATASSNPSSLNGSVASSPSSSSLSTCGGKDAMSCTKVVVIEPSRPGHKKALRSKGHHRSNNVSMDATGDCCMDQLESVALVINCEDWSESSGSGTDWTAGPPRWNNVFVIPNYKEVGAPVGFRKACKMGLCWGQG